MNKGIVIILITGRLKYKYPVGSEPTIQNNLIKPPFITPLSNWPGKPETELQKVISRVFSPLQSHDAADYARKFVKDTSTVKYHFYPLKKKYTKARMASSIFEAIRA